MASNDYTELRVKHLEMIQGVIARMSANSATVKRYAVVIAAAAVSLAKFTGSAEILMMAGAVIVVFALLDAGYLRLERSYRDLYNAVCAEGPDTRPDFRLAPGEAGANQLQLLTTWSVAGLYGVLLVFILAVIPFLTTCPS